MFTVGFSGNPKPECRITFENKQINSDGEKYIITCDNDENTVTLTIKNVDEEDEGKYVFIFENVAGTATSTGILKIIDEEP